LTNTGTTNVVITVITITGTNVADFTETNNCGSSVRPGAHCTISVNFEPQPGPATASLTLTDSSPGSRQSVPLSGTGVVSGPNATTSPAQSVTLTNYGTMTLDITSIVASGDFSESTTCGSSLAPEASCTISVTFTPKQRGKPAGTLSATDNAHGSPQTISLGGIGTVVKLSPTSLFFGCFGRLPRCRCYNLGTTTLTNTGKTPLAIDNISISGTFSQTNTCSKSLGAGLSCTITVRWSGDLSTGAVSITDNGGGSPQTVSLTSNILCH
jgi:hypothetical protein